MAASFSYTLNSPQKTDLGPGVQHYVQVTDHCRSIKQRCLCLLPRGDPTKQPTLNRLQIDNGVGASFHIEGAALW
ncbi:MAG TPA: hypothetical protein VGO22_17140 [Pseudorhizobium sp.]|jgi:hypothetical protein|nr:hypothetical protein [Pseudorhizobium sp.]